MAVFGTRALGAVIAAGLGAAAAAQIRVGVELVTTAVTVRDGRGQFISDLKQQDFDVFEDGVRQAIVTFSLTHGGRIYNVAGSTPPARTEGILLPDPRPVKNTSGRIILVLVDDKHLEPSQTPRVRALFDRVATELIQEGDMFGVVSTGTSAIEIELTYDRRRLEQAKSRIVGSGLRPRDILEAPAGAQGPAEVRHNAHVAFATAYALLDQLGKVHDRRKVLVYISNGYDLNPFAETRAKREAERLPPQDDTAPRQQTTFSEADLVSELSEVTRAAVRANVSIYAIDPRGLTAGADISEPIDMVEYQKYVTKTQDTLRVLAEQTGGRAIVNRNDFTESLKRIDAETSDYYMIGYYSNNPDASQRKRSIEIKVRRPGVSVQHRTEYWMPPAVKIRRRG
jgi:VWFA-related protein